MFTLLVPLALVAALALLLILLKSSQTREAEDWRRETLMAEGMARMGLDPSKSLESQLYTPLWLDADPPTWQWPKRVPRSMQMTATKFYDRGYYEHG